MIRKLLASLVAPLVVVTGIVTAAPAFAQDNTVNVLYAGSLVNLMERSIGPAFEKATGQHFRGYAAGSNKIANEIKGKLRRGDVFISASPTVNSSLMGEANGDHVSWYVTFAESPLMIGYNPKSKFAADFKTKRWDQVLQELVRRSWSVMRRGVDWIARAGGAGGADRALVPGAAGEVGVGTGLAVGNRGDPLAGAEQEAVAQLPVDR